MIIDFHVYLSTFGHKGQSFSHIRRSLLCSMQRLGISYSFVSPDSEPNTGVSDLDTTRALVGDHTELLMLGTVYIPKVEYKAIEKLNVLATAGDIIGIKLYPRFELFYPNEGLCHTIYELCIRHERPVVSWTT